MGARANFVAVGIFGCFVLGCVRLGVLDCSVRGDVKRVFVVVERSNFRRKFMRKKNQISMLCVSFLAELVFLQKKKPTLKTRQKLFISCYPFSHEFHFSF